MDFWILISLLRRKLRKIDRSKAKQTHQHHKCLVNFLTKKI